MALNIFDPLPANAVRQLMKQTMTAAVQPSASTIPSLWSQTFMGPGQPMLPLGGVGALYGQFADKEPTQPERLTSLDTLYGQPVRATQNPARATGFIPRSYQYPPNANLTVYPRVGYGLTPFAQLQQLAEGTPEVLGIWSELVFQINSMVKQIVHHDGDTCDDPAWQWLVDKPDRQTPINAWLSVFLYNTIVWDAPACYFMRPALGDAPNGLRNIDGSTLFCIVDENGDQPDDGAPAWSQIVYGTPIGYLSIDQLWYHPRKRRPNAPYGFPVVESANAPVSYLFNLWQSQVGFWTEGNSPEGILTAPQGWTTEQIVQHELSVNQAYAGNIKARRRMMWQPYGVALLQTKPVALDVAAYNKAARVVRSHCGLSYEAAGETVGRGLGGDSKAAAEGQEWYRETLAPIVDFVLTPLNAVVAGRRCQHGHDIRVSFDFPQATVDPSAEAVKAKDQWLSGGLTFNEYRAAIGLDPIDGEIGEWRLLPSAMSIVKPDGGILALAGKPPDAAAPHPPAVPQPPQTVAEAQPTGSIVKLLSKHCGVCPDDERFFGQPVARTLPVDMPRQGANGSEIIAIVPPDDEARAAVFKPQSAEDETLNAAIGHSQALSEEAAYLIDRALGFFLVPVAYVATIDGERGAVIHYVANHQPAKPAIEYAPQWVERAALLDTLCNQCDRERISNWLTHPDDATRPVLIDNGLSLPMPDKQIPSRSAFIDAWDRVLSDDVRTALESLCHDDATATEVASLFGADGAGIWADVCTRAKALLGDETITEIGI